MGIKINYGLWGSKKEKKDKVRNTSVIIIILKILSFMIDWEANTIIIFSHESNVIED